MPKQRPYTILIDSAEQHPFTFSDIKGDARDQYKDLIIPTARKHLGRCGADYSIEGFEGRCNIERKSVKDCQGTILGFGNDGDVSTRRERFEEELEFLAGIECGAVVVEGTEHDVCSTAPEFGKKTWKENCKILFRQILAWRQDFRVPWYFMWNRTSAEITTFQIMDRWWRKNK